MNEEWDDPDEIELLQRERDDLQEEIADLNREAILDAGLDPDDPELNDRLNDMEPGELEDLWPDTTYQEERITEIDKRIDEIKKERDESEE